ncbi:MAG: small ribosomal subunit Rsm22 family protein [Leptospirales bacterium]
MPHRKTPSDRGIPSDQDPLIRLSKGFQSHHPISGYMDRQDLLNTYRSYYHPISSAKGKVLAEEALFQKARKGFSPGPIPSPARIVDFASGTGGFAEGVVLALFQSMPQTPIELFLYDQSVSALDTASESIKRLFPEHATAHSRVTRLPGRLPLPDSIDWLLQANFLAENLEQSEQMLPVLEEAFLRLNPGGIMILTEPADKISSRNLLKIRDTLLKRLKDFHILSPCPNLRDSGCPALSNDKDWCHEDRPFDFSPEIHTLAKSAGHIKDALKMSYLIGIRSVSSPPPEVPEKSTLRLVSELRMERGLGWGIFCDGTDRQKIRLLTRHRNEQNESFWSLDRGDEIVRPGNSQVIVRSGFLDLLPDTRIERCGKPD